MEQIQTIITDAQQALELNEPDRAIDILRSKGSTNEAILCKLLAQAYFMRGDMKGDIYSCNYFAQRALDLGLRDQKVLAMLAVTSFRKNKYDSAADFFSQFVTDSSPAETLFLYGLSLYHAGSRDKGTRYLEQSSAKAPDNTFFQQELSRAQDGSLQPHEPKPFRVIPQPKALTEPHGQAGEPRDFYWLKKNIPCQDACPAQTNIPEYLRAIFDEDYDRAYEINLRDNVFPGILGRVCARPCEAQCRHGWEGLGDPVQICFSKRAASDLKGNEPVVLPKLAEKSGKKVAVIGAGVAGLSAARELALLGHDVVVYEKHTSPGGMLNQGIPVFRLPRELIEHEIDQIRKTGVRIECGVEVGKDITMQDIMTDNDAVVMAAGTLRPNILNLPGKELRGIRHGLDFLLEVNETGSTEIGEQVVVIGGGFTAMDCARTAQRLGAKSVKVCYRRSKNEMLVTPGELEELEQEGIPVEYMITPSAYIGSGGAVEKVRFIRTELGEPDASGRRRPVPIEGSEFDEPATTVLLATGQFPETSWIDSHLHTDLVDTDQWLLSGRSHTTRIKNLFVAGDFATGARSLIEAIGHAKECAVTVDTYLMGRQRVVEFITIVDVQDTGRIKEMDDVPLQPMPVIPVADRTLPAEVETGFDAELAKDETQRCYLCHFKFEIDSDKCIYCDWCIKAKPRPNCIVKVSSLQYDDEGRIIGFTRAKGSEDTTIIYINQEDCIRCGYCVDACPVDCISIQKVNLGTQCCDPVSPEKNKE